MLRRGLTAPVDEGSKHVWNLRLLLSVYILVVRTRNLNQGTFIFISSLPSSWMYYRVGCMFYSRKEANTAAKVGHCWKPIIRSACPNSTSPTYWLQMRLNASLRASNLSVQPAILVQFFFFFFSILVTRSCQPYSSLKHRVNEVEWDL
jgi:hypothetical protein